MLNLFNVNNIETRMMPDVFFKKLLCSENIGPIKVLEIKVFIAQGALKVK